MLATQSVELIVDPSLRADFPLCEFILLKVGEVEKSAGG